MRLVRPSIVVTTVRRIVMVRQRIQARPKASCKQLGLYRFCGTETALNMIMLGHNLMILFRQSILGTRFSINYLLYDTAYLP